MFCVWRTSSVCIGNLYRCLHGNICSAAVYERVNSLLHRMRFTQACQETLRRHVSLAQTGVELLDVGTWRPKKAA